MPRNSMLSTPKPSRSPQFFQFVKKATSNLPGLGRSAQMRWGLGIGDLWPEWKQLFTTKYLKDDLVAGLTVACIAIPLSLAIALASGVHPSVGLITAIVGGIVCAIFGGTPLSVSGPAAAMAVLIASVVQEFGMSGLLIVALGCGLLQLLTGIFCLGQLVRFVPLPVIAGFTAGIGAIILIGQLPRALGLAPPDESHVFDVITHVHDLIHETHIPALILSLSTVALTLILPRVFPRLPAPLVAVLIPSFLVYYFQIPVETIGAIPNSLPTPRLPHFTAITDWGSIASTTFIVYALASLETLLSSSAVDKLMKGVRHDPDQELIGQGLGNIASSLFGGIPVTGVIARSALNIQSGAKTRRAALFHSLILIATVYLLAPVMSQIPTAVLAGVLLSVALRMLHPREFLQLWESSTTEAIVYAVTFVTILCLDLIMGVQAGVAAALLIAAVRLGRARANVQIFKTGSPSLLSIEGPLTFLSSSKVEEIRRSLADADLSQGLIIDLTDVSTMDASGASQLGELFESLQSRQVTIALQGLSQDCKKILLSQDHDGKWGTLVRQSDPDALNLVHENKGKSLDRLVSGVQRFRQEMMTHYGGLFRKLAQGQTPHTLFITCSDSRIDPNLITSTVPGELFIVRNVGNLIPGFGKDETPAEGAAVEFAIGVLNVKDIVVCGHSGCGAMNAILSGSLFSEDAKKNFPSLSKWLLHASTLKNQLPPEATADQAAEMNAVVQLENLKTYPLIQERLQRGEIKLHAWYYDIGDGKLQEWDEVEKLFVDLGSKATRNLRQRIESGVQFQAPLGPVKK